MAGVAIEGTRVLPEPGPAGTAASPASEVAVTAADTDQRLIELWLYGRAKRTQRAYQADIAAFNRFVQKPLRQLTLGELQSYQDSLQHLATASQARRLSSIKSLLSFGQKTGYLTLNVGAAIFLPKIKQTLAERILAEDDVLRMLALERNTRNRALLRLLYLGGLRASVSSANCASVISWRARMPVRSQYSARAATPGRCS